MALFLTSPVFAIFPEGYRSLIKNTLPPYPNASIRVTIIVRVLGMR